MRPIHLVRLDKVRPALVLTREIVRDSRSQVTVAPITSTVWGLTSEVPLGPANGLDRDCVANIDNVQTIPASDIGKLLGYLRPEQEHEVAAAVIAAFDLQQ